jgi:hypothetical protein
LSLVPPIGSPCITRGKLAQGLPIDKRHWNQMLASAPLIPTFAGECAAI